MARDEDDDIDDQDEAVANAADDVEKDLPVEEPEEKSDEREAAPTDKDTEEELEDADIEGEDQATKKTPEQEMAEEADRESAEHKEEPDLSPFAAPKPTNEIDRYKNFMDEYKRLQEQRNKADVVNGLIAAGGKIGQSLAGKYSGNFVPDQTGNQMLNAMANRPLQEFGQGQMVQQEGMKNINEVAANDPTSPQSKLVRDYLNKRIPGLNLAPDVSAADAQMLMKTIGRPVQESMRFVNLTNTNPTSPDYGKTIMGKLSKTGAMYDSKGNPLNENYVIQNAEQVMKDANGNIIGVNKNIPGMAPRQIQSSAYKPVESMTPQEVTNFKPDINQRKALGEEQKRMDTMTKAAREGVTAATNLEKALKSSNVYQGATLKTTLPKLMGFNGRMSPLEQQMWTGSQAWNDRMEQYLQTASEGTLTDKNKQEALALLEDFKTNVNGDLQNIAKGSQQHLQQVYSIPGNFSAKAIQFPALASSGTHGDMVQVTSAKTGKTFMLPKDKVKDALAKKLINPLAQ